MSSRNQPAWNSRPHVTVARWPAAAAVEVVAVVSAMAVAAVAAVAAAAIVCLCFLPVHCRLASGSKGVKHIKHTRRAAGDPIEDRG